MKKFIKTVSASFTIWVAAALINGLLVAALSLFVNHDSGELGLTFGLVIVFSLLFSIPGIFIFWLFFIANYFQEGLFQLLLKTALFTSLFSALIFFGWVGRGFHSDNIWLIIFAVVAAVASVMIHHGSVRNIVNENKNQTHV